MGYRWKPNRAQKEAYKAKMQEREALNVRTAHNAIRTGCRVKYYSLSRGEVIEGIVTSHSYGEKTGQHTFTINNEIKVKGRNLYPNILEHIQGEESLKIS